jgi:hypothetical protein
LFFPLDVTTSHLISEGHPKKSVAVDVGDFLDSTNRNYFVKLWAKLSAKKTPVVREG